MATLDRYQVKTYADAFFVMDDRFKKYLHQSSYGDAVYAAEIFNENIESIPVDPSTRNPNWKSTPKECL